MAERTRVIDCGGVGAGRFPTAILDKPQMMNVPDQARLFGAACIELVCFLSEPKAAHTAYSEIQGDG